MDIEGLTYKGYAIRATADGVLYIATDNDAYRVWFPNYDSFKIYIDDLLSKSC